MLASLFGNSTAEKVLLFLEANETAYAQQIADALSIRLSVVQKQVRRLEQGGVLISRAVGRTRVFGFNPRFGFTDELRALLRRALSTLPDAERLPYLVRQRPRLTGKPIETTPRSER
jgi:hypothetical protein